MEEGEIIEGDNYLGDSKAFGFKEIVLSQLQRVVNNSSREMRAGFWIMTNNPQVTSQKVRYVGDSRKELVQSIDTLHDLLLAKFDEEMKKETKIINKSLEERENKKDWSTTQPLYRKLFQEICLFLDRKGWLQSGSIVD